MSSDSSRWGYVGWHTIWFSRSEARGICWGAAFGGVVVWTGVPFSGQFLFMVVWLILAFIGIIRIYWIVMYYSEPTFLVSVGAWHVLTGSSSNVPCVSTLLCGNVPCVSTLLCVSWECALCEHIALCEQVNVIVRTSCKLTLGHSQTACWDTCSCSSPRYAQKMASTDSSDYGPQGSRFE